MFRLIGLCCLSVCLLSGKPIAAADNAPVTLLGGSVFKPKVKVGDNVVVVTTDGRVTTGVLVKDGKELITLKLKGSGLKEVPRKEIEDISKAKASFVRKDVDPKERFLVLTPGGPIVVEVTIMSDGKPFRLAREELTAKIIKMADGDGKSTWKEASANPRFGFGRFVDYTRSKAQRQAALKRFDRNGNGIVDVEDARFLITELGGWAAFNISQGAKALSQPNIMKVLDTDGDGVISQEELKSAAEKLKSRDANDNDLLESSEVGGGRSRNQYRSQLVNRRRTTGRTGTTAYVLGPTANLAAIFTALQTKYGGEDKAIRASNFRWLPGLVTELDLDKNGTLDSREMVGLHLVSPHVVLKVNFGKDEMRPQGIRFVSISKLLGNQNRVGDKFFKQITIERPGMRLSFVAQNSSYLSTVNHLRSAQTILSRFDTNKNGYIEKEEIKKVAGNLVAHFDRWDADGDGKVYAKEIEAFYRDQLTPSLTAVTAMASNKGPSFFNALDETGDNRISLREMKLAAKRLASFDENGDGKLGIDEMPVEMSVTFSRGPNYSGRYQRKGGGIRPLRTVASAPKGPNWFVRMDKNGDGDLTRREFLGGKEKFKQLDTNSDGFIERKEAEAVTEEKPKTPKVD